MKVRMLSQKLFYPLFTFEQIIMLESPMQTPPIYQGGIHTYFQFSSVLLGYHELFFMIQYEIQRREPQKTSASNLRTGTREITRLNITMQPFSTAHFLSNH